MSKIACLMTSQQSVDHQEQMPSLQQGLLDTVSCALNSRTPSEDAAKSKESSDKKRTKKCTRQHMPDSQQQLPNQSKRTDVQGLRQTVPLQRFNNHGLACL